MKHLKCSLKHLAMVIEKDQAHRESLEIIHPNEMNGHLPPTNSGSITKSNTKVPLGLEILRIEKPLPSSADELPLPVLYASSSD